MSSLHRGDEEFHHSDGSHRWSGGPLDARGRKAYLAALREHLERHRIQPEEERPQPRRT